MAKADKLKLRARELHRAITVLGDAIFFPTGGVFLKITLDRFKTIILTGSETDSDVWSIYARRHESVHMLQLVTSPYVCLEAFRLASIARAAFHYSKDKGHEDAEFAELKEAYRSTSSELSGVTAEGYSPEDILETHAVTQGLLWAMPDDTGSLWELANHLYKDKGNPSYIRLLNSMAERLGGEVAIRLLPRLCFVALQSGAPVKEITYLSKKVISEHTSAYLCNCTPRQFCEWAGVDVAFVSRSLRERKTPLQDHPWLALFGHYFDDFESIPSIDRRLDLLMGLHGAETFKIFEPSFTVFEDGDLLFSRRMTDTYAEEDREMWITITHDYVEGFGVLVNS